MKNTDQDHIVHSSASELAKSIREKRLSSVEIIEAHLAQIEKYNPRLNVIVTLDADRARARARDADAALAQGEIWGPLHGVPITVKDGFATSGIRTTSGNPPWADFVPDYDAPVVARLREAGVIILGKTNVPVLSLDQQTDNPIFGRTNNPWDLSRTCGGSTGGAAAVAAGLTPLEIGADGGGSVRMPAHCCGVYGLKPSDYRVPGGGFNPNPIPEPQTAETGGPAQIGVFGPLARSVEDLALMYKVIVGPAPDRWDMPPVPVGSMPRRNLKPLRLAWTDDFGVPVDTETRSVLANLAHQLANAGHQVERCVPGKFDFIRAGELWGEMIAVIFGFPVEFEEYAGAEAPTLRGMAKGIHLTLPEYMDELKTRGALIAALEAFFNDWDALICPVMSVPAFHHQESGKPILVDDQLVHYDNATILHNAPFNLTGHPVVVLPAGKTSQGLPVGVQVVGRRWGEMPLLAVAKQIARMIGPFQFPPGYE
jgi:amidase